VAALEGERGWRERRPQLSVTLGTGARFHVTASVNRESIATHGLDWRRMGTAPGIANSRWKPELPCVLLCHDGENPEFFILMGRQPCDVWAVQVDGLWLESGPVGWDLLPAPVPPERLSLVERDVDPNAVRARWAAASSSTEMSLTGGVRRYRHYARNDRGRPRINVEDGRRRITDNHTQMRSSRERWSRQRW